MPQTQLTDLSIRNIQPPPTGQATYWDGTLPGFGLRISQGGTKSFVLVHGRSRQRVTIGRYPIITLSQARTKAKEMLAEHTLGKQEAPTLKFEEALTLFGTTHCDKNNRARTSKETKRLLTKHFLPKLRHERLENIATHTIASIVDRLLDTPSEANHAFAAIRLFFRWAARRKYVGHSPCEGLRAPTQPVARERVLTDQELKRVLRAARGEDSTFGSIVQLLILTGQRCTEIASLRTEFVDEKARTVTLPASLTKNKRQHTFPFGKRADAVLRSAQPRDGYLFPARGKEKPFNGWSKSKRAFDARCSIEPWTLHDLRRTFATNLASLGVPVHVTEKLLNHVSGTTGGIVAVYQRHAYLDEMRDAIARWEKHLSLLLRRREAA